MGGGQLISEDGNCVHSISPKLLGEEYAGYRETASFFREMDILQTVTPRQLTRLVQVPGDGGLLCDMPLLFHEYHPW